MFKVLLIDDEPLIGNVIRTLFDWKRHGFEFVGEAYSGTEALGMIEESQPHIAIIDVNMPEMNGVELQGILRERYPAVKTIMLSSYDDYDYVRECLRNGAVDYLLKHRLDEAVLLNVLHKAVKDLQEENREQEGRLASKKMAETMKPVFIRSRVAELVRENEESEGTSDAASGMEGWYPGAVRFAAAALQIIPFLLLTETFSDIQTNRLVQQAVDVMQQSLGDIHERTAAYVENGRLIVVFAFKELSEHAGTSEAHRWMGKIQHALELMLNLKSVYALGHPCASLTQLGTSYRSAEKALDTTPLVENSTRFDNLNHSKPAVKERSSEQHLPQRVALTIEEQKQLLLALESLDQERMQQLIASVCGSVHLQPLHSPAVQMIVSELLHTGDKALKKSISTPAAEAAVAELPARRDLGRIGSMDELEQWLKSYFTALLNLLKHQRAAGSYSRHVSQAIHFILERYQGYITLEMVAGAIGLNPSYLSRLFKEETQCNFSEYVNRIRIDAAQKLLESDQYSVKQISSQVGFTTYNYFFKVFKELTGMTPHAYVGSLRPERQR